MHWRMRLHPTAITLLESLKCLQLDLGKGSKQRLPRHVWGTAFSPERISCVSDKGFGLLRVDLVGDQKA